MRKWLLGGIALSLCAQAALAQNSNVVTKEAFKNPPFEYRPTAQFEEAGGPRPLATGTCGGHPHECH
jgi:hypothetical protein